MARFATHSRHSPTGSTCIPASYYLGTQLGHGQLRMPVALSLHASQPDHPSLHPFRFR
jgi:hypothetical protein